MKIEITRTYRVKIDKKVYEYTPGVYSVPGEISKERADRIIQVGRGKKVQEKKKSPENKVLAGAPENKAKVAAVHSRGTGAKSDN